MPLQERLRIRFLRFITIKLNMTTISNLTLLAGILTAIAGATVGNFLLMRKMVLVSDSMPHIALPGIALGVLYHFNPLLGAILFLIGAVIVIWLLGSRTFLATESIVGVLFVSSLALGALLIPEEELLEAFFGSITSINQNQALAQIITASLVIISLVYYFKPLVLSSLAPELAASLKINTRLIELYFLVLIALVVAIGINFVGVLLMSSLLIIPAVSARNLTHRLNDFFVTSSCLGIISLLGGLFLASYLYISPGIMIVLTSTFIFVLSLGLGAWRKE